MTARSGSARSNVYALIDGSGNVQNIIAWNGVATYALAAGYSTAQALDDVKLLDTYSASTFSSSGSSR